MFAESAQRRRQEEGAGKKRTGSTSFFTPADPFNSRGIRAAREMSRKLKLPGRNFRANVTGRAREITLVELNLRRHYARRFVYSRRLCVNVATMMSRAGASHDFLLQV